ncbi:quinone-dependent dihydroorotate dehydrogenase [Sphingomonas sp.]|jgi:dihydroorotate dehydrogenase|uniref:quinone-dependent dihydroorotate dehydrogenase n=1 Tax=Sphingomonas sp. TaxID=28214 RepID=UPI00261C74A4|nr:quinone-dependent dihydroorotate dehydrogenase [Sphingomonas sp.]MDF2495092.1 dihydroorotate dehydrogenase [Sphingomonas sp.]
MTFPMRPALFALDAERAHRLTIRALSLWGRMGAPGGRSVSDPILATTLASLNFANPLGLAAGVDKDGEAVTGLHALGFGAVEVGTLTPVPQPGNPKPRLFRLVEDEAVINRMGFNNGGLSAALERLPTRRHGVLGLNVGANKDTTDRVADYVAGVSAAARVADYVTINVSSPNTPGLRDLQHGSALRDLLAATRSAAGSRPLFLKVAPDLDHAAIDDIAAAVIDHRLDALIIGNTTISRPPLASSNAGENGGLSGAPLAVLARQKLTEFRTATGGAIPLIAVGGIGNGVEAYARIRAGASLVQLYSAMVFAGPGLPVRILTDLAALLRRDGYGSITEAVGGG